MPFFSSLRQHLPHGTEQPTFAALDLGSHNCRLLIARQEGDRLRVLDRFSQIVRLGEGLASSGALSEEAMQRTIKALYACAGRIARYPVTDAHFVATEACRTASNGDQFIRRVKDVTGLELRILSHKDEAVLAFLGCTPLVRDDTDYALLVDIGGGSIELLLVNMQSALEPKISGWLSLPLGIITLTEKLEQEGNTPAAHSRIKKKLARNFGEFAERYGLRELAETHRLQVIGCAASVTMLAALAKGLTRYERQEIDGITLSASSLRRTCQELRGMEPADRIDHPCIGEGRAPYALAGCMAVEALLKALPVDGMTIADRGIREGILFSLLKKHLRAMA